MMIDRKTIFSQDRQYRYTLWREWARLLLFPSVPAPYVMFIGLNPSTAAMDDPTIRRCIGFAKKWGYGALCMTNLFAWRSTDPAALVSVYDPVGPDNDTHLVSVAAEAAIIVCAWGVHGNLNDRGTEAMKILPKRIMCLARNRDGSHKHPLYLKSDAQPIPFQ